MTTTAAIAGSAPPESASKAYMRFAGSFQGSGIGPAPLFEALLALPVFTEPAEDELPAKPSEPAPSTDVSRSDESDSKVDVEDNVEGDGDGDGDGDDDRNDVDASQAVITVVPSNQPLNEIKSDVRIVDQSLVAAPIDDAQNVETTLTPDQVQVEAHDAEQSWLNAQANDRRESQLTRSVSETQSDAESRTPEADGTTSLIPSVDCPTMPTAVLNGGQQSVKDSSVVVRHVRHPDEHQQKEVPQTLRQTDEPPIESKAVVLPTALVVENESSQGDKSSNANISEKGRRSQRLNENRESRSDQRDALRQQKHATSSQSEDRASSDRSPVLSAGKTKPTDESVETADGLMPAKPTVNPLTAPQTIAHEPAIDVSNSLFMAAANSALSNSNSPADLSLGTVSQDTASGASTAGVSTGGGLRASESASIRAPASEGSRGALTAHQETRLLQRVMRGFEQLGANPGQVRLRLHPPQLGSLQMTLHVDSDMLSARLEVESIAARDTLMENLPQLRQRLAEQGIQVERFDVQLQPRDDSRQRTYSSFDQQSSGQGSFDSDRRPTHSNWRSTLVSDRDVGHTVTSVASRVLRGSSSGLDLRF